MDESAKPAVGSGDAAVEKVTDKAAALDINVSSRGHSRGLSYDHPLSSKKLIKKWML